MDNNTQQGATGTAAGQSAGAGSPTATAGQQTGAATGTAQAAVPTGTGNQSTGNAAAGQSTQGGQTVPLAVVTQLREKNRQLEALVLEAREQNAAVMQRLEQMQAVRTAPTTATGDGIAPQDEAILTALEQRIERKFGPVFERFGNVSKIVEMQDQQARMERARQARERIAQQHPIYAHKLLGAGAMAELQSKIAQYESMRIPINAFEVAEEVAAKWNAVKAEYDADVAQSLVSDARRAAPGAGTGAAVTSGQSGPVTTPGTGFVGLKAKSEQFKAELLRQRAAGAGAA